MNRGSVYALAVGIDSYEDPEITPLRYAAADATAFSNLLTQKWGLTPGESLFLMTDKTEPLPLDNNILFRIGKLGQMTTPHDTFILYFSGHGQCIHDKSVLYTFNTDTRDPDALEMSSISLDLLRSKLSKINAAQIILFLDACRSFPERSKSASDNSLSEAFARDISALVQPQPGLSRSQKSQAIGLVFSCSRGQRSYEPECLGGGLFTHFLLKTLTEWPSNHIPLNDLHTRVSKQMKEFARVELPSGKEQQPWIDFAGGMVPCLDVLEPRRESEKTIEPQEVEAPAGSTYPHSLLPRTKEEIDRSVEIEDEAKVQGRVYGAVVSIGSRACILGDIVSRTRISVGLDARVEGRIVAGSSVEYSGKHCAGIWAPSVSISSATYIEGRVWCTGPINIPDNSIISHGVLTEGDARIGNECTIGPLKARSLHLGDKVSLAAVRASGELIAGQNLLFTTAHAGGSISIGDRGSGKVLLSDSWLNIGSGSKIGFVSGSAQVTLGPACKISLVIGHDVIIGEECQADCVLGFGSVILKKSCQVGSLFAQQRLEIGDAVKIATPTVVCLKGPIKIEKSCFLRETLLLHKHVFKIMENGEIVTASTSANGTLITSLLTHSLLEAIENATGVRLRISLS